MAVLPEDSVSVLSTHEVGHNCDPSSRRSRAFFWSPMAPDTRVVYTYIHTDRQTDKTPKHTEEKMGWRVGSAVKGTWLLFPRAWV